MQWNKEDPRFTIYKSRHIIILRPHTPGFNRPLVSLGLVDTKHSYYVSTDFEEPYNHLGVNDNWPNGWQWVFIPNGVFKNN